jgi:hypothetical protein
LSTSEQQGGAGQPSEEELRAYEAELARLTTTDMILQVSVSLLNLGARRLAPGSQEGAAGRDLEQVRDAIDAARGLLAILERRVPQEIAPLRDALSQLQMAYAREVSADAGAGAPAEAPGAPERPADGAGPQAPGGGEGEPGGGAEGGGEPGAGPGEQQRRPGPAEASGRLWIPGT